jgi:RNA polymerase sigma factor (sigma-70 family)
MPKETALQSPPGTRAHAVSMHGGLPVSATAAADQVYLEHAVVMRRVAIRKFRVPAEDAEALVHDVFINYIASTRNVRTDLRAYLVGAICNACRNYWRSRTSEERVFDDEGPVVADVLSERDLFEGVARTMVVAATLSRLGSRCREALKRYYLDEEDTRTVAAAMNTSSGNVNYLMHTCRKQARAIYERISRMPR